MVIRASVYRGVESESSVMRTEINTVVQRKPVYFAYLGSSDLAMKYSFSADRKMPPWLPDNVLSNFK
jgi:hypothetical protein